MYRTYVYIHNKNSRNVGAKMNVNIIVEVNIIESICSKSWCSQSENWKWKDVKWDTIISTPFHHSGGGAGEDS